MFLISGQVPVDASTGKTPAAIEDQTRLVLENLKSALALQRLTLCDVVRTRLFLRHLNDDYDVVNRIYAEFFQPPYPVRTTIGCELRGFLVEMDADAHRKRFRLRRHRTA
jgi:2-iminobutanoate/2-iminopropanoate deaminase